MYEKFGELGSHTEINELAGNLLKEGDQESVRALAEENGIPGELAEMYLEGGIPVLADAVTAALGKIEKEEAELKPRAIMKDWVDYLKVQAMENEELACRVRKKGKSLKGCMGKLLKWSFGHQEAVDVEILKKSGIKAGRVTLGIPGMAEAKKIIRGYYMER